jgi:hypothetical protein
MWDNTFLLLHGSPVHTILAHRYPLYHLEFALTAAASSSSETQDHCPHWQVIELCEVTIRHLLHLCRHLALFQMPDREIELCVPLLC